MVFIRTIRSIRILYQLRYNCKNNRLLNQTHHFPCFIGRKFIFQVDLHLPWNFEKKSNVLHFLHKRMDTFAFSPPEGPRLVVRIAIFPHLKVLGGSHMRGAVVAHFLKRIVLNYFIK